VSEARIALDLAAFLDSRHAGRTPGLARDAERAALETFLRAAYLELGKAPRLLDEQELSELLRRILPGRYGRHDAVIPHLVALLGRYYDHLEETETVADVFEVRRALNGSAEDFLRAVRRGEVGHETAPPVAPIVNKAPKLGRNDPCWCGSGKKFKKCHGAAG
jgi:hypothetical protein